MRKKAISVLNRGIQTVFVAVLLLVPMETARATKPGQETNPNGFPSGEHFNLNIIGKKAEFTCPEQEFDEFGDPIYGKVIFVPEFGSDIQILMQSGKGKWASQIDTLQVIDPCTAAFDGDAAVLQLPDRGGYHVYARAQGKPTDEPTLEIVPDLMIVQDEAGNDLIYLGLVTSNGFETPYVSFTRKKGKSKAVDITGLFEWSGHVCYFDDAFCDPIEVCELTDICCVIGDDDFLESCEVKGEEELCPEETVEFEAFCREYVNEWVFNIGDFVEYLWEVTNQGVKLVNVRFYPVK